MKRAKKIEMVVWAVVIWALYFLLVWPANADDIMLAPHPAARPIVPQAPMIWRIGPPPVFINPSHVHRYCRSPWSYRWFVQEKKLCYVIRDDQI